MPTTPPDKAPQRATAPRRGGPSGKKSGKNRKSWWRSPWIPLGHLVAGLALSLGFHVTFRLWDQTRTYKPLDLSPPFAAKPLPGTSLDSLVRRYRSQLSPLLNPPPLPDRPAPPPLALTPDSPASGPAPAVTRATPERRDGGPTENQPPAPPSFGTPPLPSPPPPAP